jgi:hypothetical protein
MILNLVILNKINKISSIKIRLNSSIKIRLKRHKEQIIKQITIKKQLY